MVKTKNHFKLSASVICANMLSLKRDISYLKKGQADCIHFDVMDGIFVPRYGLHPEMLEQIHSVIHVPIEVHMMVKNPIIYIEKFIKAGADIITVHPESVNNLKKTISFIKNKGAQAGIALNPQTSLDIINGIIKDISLIMVMGINPGIVGHPLIPATFKRIYEVKRRVKNFSNMIIEVDGGVTFKSAPEMIKIGANMLVCGTSTIFNHPERIDLRLKELRSVINNAVNEI